VAICYKLPTRVDPVELESSAAMKRIPVVAALGVVAVFAASANASTSTYAACEGHSSATFKAEMKVRPYNCLALGRSTSSTTNLAHMRWFEWTPFEAFGIGLVISNHYQRVGGREVLLRYPIAVRLSQPAHLCDGEESSFSVLEWLDQFGHGTDKQTPDCP
jgi:hypothetical protein